MDLTFTKYDVQKGGEQITGYSTSEINKNILNTNIYIYIHTYIHIYRMGLSESALKPFSCLSHCKVSCDSPWCVKLCREDNHCMYNIDTHENVISDEEEQIEKQK